MRPIVPVRWAEGMFLTPQHFQQSDLYQDTRLTYHLKSLNTFHWGVFRLQLDADALENMILRVDRCEITLPDGLVIDYPESAIVDEESFQDEFPGTASSLGVYLTLRALNPEEGITERYDQRTVACRDLLFRDNEAQIDFLIPSAKLLFCTSSDDDRLTGRQSIKIAEIRRTGRTSPRFELSPHYYPPALSLHAAPGLVGLVNEIVERLCSASRLFGQFRRERGPEAIGYGVGDLEQLLARQMLNQYIPALMNSIANECIHPYVVYGLLAELRGALTSYWPEEESSDFPPYNHEDLAGCYGAICESIRQLLERLLPTHYLELPLVRDANYRFQTEIEESVFGRANAFILALRPAVPENELLKRMETQAKLSSINDMHQLVGYADRGVPLQHMPIPPAEIPRYAGYTYFRCDINDPRWRRIRNDSAFSFFLADAEPAMEGRLFVILSKREFRPPT